MNFVVSIVLGVIVGGIALWQMSRNDNAEGESEDSKAVSIEVINGDSDENIGDDIATEADDEIVIEPENEPHPIDVADVEPAKDAIKEIAIKQESKSQSSDRADVESSADSTEEIVEEIVEEITIELEVEPQSSNGADVEAAEFVEAESTEAEDAETDIEALQKIIGIGPTYARRIYDAGITSVEALSELTEASLQQIVTPGKSTPTSETKKWLEQARQLVS